MSKSSKPSLYVYCGKYNRHDLVAFRILSSSKISHNAKSSSFFGWLTSRSDY